jgi:hypothetical protein
MPEVCTHINTRCFSWHSQRSQRPLLILMDCIKTENDLMVTVTVVRGEGRIFAIYNTPPPPHSRNYLNTSNLATNLWRREAGRLPAAILREIFVDVRHGVVSENVIVSLSHCTATLPCKCRKHGSRSGGNTTYTYTMPITKSLIHTKGALCLKKAFIFTRFNTFKLHSCRFQCQCGLRHGSAAVRLLGLRVRIPAGGMDVCLLYTLCFQVDVSASGWPLVQRSRTECDMSECDREALIMTKH